MCHTCSALFPHFYPQMFVCLLFYTNYTHCVPHVSSSSYVSFPHGCKHVCYLEIINSLLKNNVNILKQITWTSKNGIKILVSQVVLEVLIKMCKILFWSLPQEPLDLLKFQCHCPQFLNSLMDFHFWWSWYSNQNWYMHPENLINGNQILEGQEVLEVVVKTKFCTF